MGEVGFARLPYDVRYVEHRAVGGQVLRLVRLDESEDKAQDTDDQTEVHDMYAVQRGASHIEADVGQVGQYDVCLAGKCGCRTEKNRKTEGKQCG